MKFEWDLKPWTDFADRLTDTKQFDFYCKKMTKEMSKILLGMIFDKTPVKTGKLAEGWLDGSNLAYKVQEVDNGFEVTFTNKVEYATWVNDGHLVRNQPNGAYLRVKRRTVPYYDGRKSNYFVYGHFFVEKSIVQLTDGSHQLEQIMRKELDKWYRRCASGK